MKNVSNTQSFNNYISVTVQCNYNVQDGADICITNINTLFFYEMWHICVRFQKQQERKAVCESIRDERDRRYL